MKNVRLIDKIVFFLLLLGGFNWGLVGLFEWDLVGAIFGGMSVVSRLIYILIGLSAVYRFVIWVRAKISKK